MPTRMHPANLTCSKPNPGRPAGQSDGGGPKVRCECGALVYFRTMRHGRCRECAIDAGLLKDEPIHSKDWKGFR